MTIHSLRSPGLVERAGRTLRRRRFGLASIWDIEAGLVRLPPYDKQIYAFGPQS